jgi:DNA-binding NarL/FixJ family response regulator
MPVLQKKPSISVPKSPQFETIYVSVPWPTSFTPREKQIAALLLKGEKRASMAATLKIHVNTVHFHLRNLSRKVGSTSLIELVLKCAKLNGALKHWTP